MTESAAPTRSVVVEREMLHPPEKVWRASTEGPLIEQWLMKNDFQPVVGHRFQFRAMRQPHWNDVIECEVLVVEPYQRLSYSWNLQGEEVGGTEDSPCDDRSDTAAVIPRALGLDENSSDCVRSHATRAETRSSAARAAFEQSDRLGSLSGPLILIVSCGRRNREPLGHADLLHFRPAPTRDHRVRPRERAGDSLTS